MNATARVMTIAASRGCTPLHARSEQNHHHPERYTEWIIQRPHEIRLGMAGHAGPHRDGHLDDATSAERQGEEDVGVGEMFGIILDQELHRSAVEDAESRGAVMDPEAGGEAEQAREQS